YLKSQWGYDERAKQQELTATTARYLLVRNASARPVAYVHFRFVEDEGRAVLYCFELQVEPDYQQKGIGAQLIDCLEQLANATQMELLMATVFAFNGASLAFFHKRGFRTDSSCRWHRGGGVALVFGVISSLEVKSWCQFLVPRTESSLSLGANSRSWSRVSGSIPGLESRC
uniref:N-alpha-acetyltransferase 40 n=1 Tax=Globodera pallida TaxID=36090 RepID=A0A183CK91_GLOPA